MKRRYPWKIGDVYWIYDETGRVHGTIIYAGGDGYIVKWQDNSETMERNPSPANDWWKLQEQLHSGTKE